MHPQADAFSTLNAWIDAPQVLSGLIGAAIVGVVGLLVQAYVARRRMGFTVLYDQQINQGDPARRPVVAAGAGAAADAAAEPSRHMWEIVYRDTATGADEYTVEGGSLVVLRLRNLGWRTIREEDFTRGRITVSFPGRRVVHYKVRDNDEYHQIVNEAQVSGEADFRPPVPGESSVFHLPAFTLERGEGFELLTLLVDDPGHVEPDRDPKVNGRIAAGGQIKEIGRGRRRVRNVVATLGVLVLVAAGVIIGVRVANQGLALNPACAQGNLTIEGSTAFAPIFNQAVTAYEQQCPGANITVAAVGSVQGLDDLKAAKDKGPVIVMYDGVPPEDPGIQYDSRPVGDVIFAVVGNRSLEQVKPTVFTPDSAQVTDGGMTKRQVASAYTDPASGLPGGYHPAGRTGVSGTREVFVKTILAGTDGSDSAENAAARSGNSCAQGVTGVCVAQTTMDVLGYVSTTRNAIGYAEDDALTYFPNVAAIPVNGAAPTRANALDGTYTFLATEHLYTYGAPTGLAADVISFLTSSGMTSQLRGATASFIACGDLGGSALSDDCAPS